MFLSVGGIKILFNDVKSLNKLKWIDASNNEIEIWVNDEHPFNAYNTIDETED